MCGQLPRKIFIMKHDYKNMTITQAIFLGCKRGFSNYFALGGVVWKWLRRRG